MVAGSGDFRVMYVVLAGMIIVESLVLGALWGTYCEQASAICWVICELFNAGEELYTGG